MKLLLASSELHPFSKSGGLADMVGALAKSLAALGHQVGVVTPLYRGIQKKFPDIRPFDWHLDLPLGDSRVTGGVRVLEPADNLTLYFIDQPHFYDRDGLYTGAWPYEENAARFIFFSKAVANLARYLPWQPELVHVHDWQVGLVPLMIRDQAARDGWQNAPRTCLTIHNLAYQGNFDAAAYALTNLPPDYFHSQGAEAWKQLNCLKAALEYSDVLTTVSPRYAREITTELYGCGLDGVLRRRQHVLTGILNGVDYDEWNTYENGHLLHRYSIEELRGKDQNKAALQLEMGLPIEPRVPLFASVTRLADQKGVDIQLAALQEMIAAKMQFVLLGSGDPLFENAYRELARRHPQQVAVRLGFNNGLSHRIEAGADFFLMPSRFEPCGLNQMYSQRYGTIPIVRRTGGLADSVQHFDAGSGLGTGVVFNDYDVGAVHWAVETAFDLYADKPRWKQLVQNAMAQDFSWQRRVADYVALYERLINAA